jgi:hypothetical protein
MKRYLIVSVVALLAIGGPTAFAQSGSGTSPGQMSTSKQMDQRMMQQLLDQQQLRTAGSSADSITHGQHQASTPASSSSLAVPKPLQVEHEELHSALARLTKVGGQTGQAAQRLAEILDHHFQKENEYALPPLGLLVPLSQDKFECHMTAVLPLTDRLQAEMSTMLSEHQDIAAALNRLRNAADSDNKSTGVQFADHLAAHAQMEEQVTYPTAVLIGLYVKSKSSQCAR